MKLLRQISSLVCILALVLLSIVGVFSPVQEAQAAAVREQLVSGSSSGSTTISATWGSATSAGNLLVALIAFEGGTDITITPPDPSWNLADRGDSGIKVGTAIYYIDNAASESGVSTWTFSVSKKAALVLVEYSGVLTASPLDKTASQGGAGVVADSGLTAATTKADEIAIASLVTKEIETFSAQTNGFSEIGEYTGSDRVTIAFEEKILSATGTQQVQADTSDNKEWAGVIATFKLVTIPLATTPGSISQSADDSGYMSFQTTLSDPNSDETRLKVEYSDDGGVSWYDPDLVSATPNNGAVDLDDAQTYQIGTVNGIDSDDFGSVTLTIVWDTQSASNGNGSLDGTDQSDIQVRVTPNDAVEDGAVKTSGSFSVDNLNPSGLTALTTGATTYSTQVLNWSVVTETNFNHYEIWYGDDQGDVQGRTGTAAEWDNGDDGAMATRTTATTTITGLSGTTTYYYKIWAIDDYGNLETVVDINQATPNASPTGSFNSATQKIDGSGDVDLSIEVDDNEGSDTKAKLEYETDSDGACNGPWGAATLIGPATADFDDSGGAPDVAGGAYQVGTTATTRIITSSGSNTVQFDWDSDSDLPAANGTQCLRLTVNDDTEDQATPDTQTVSVDNVSPSGLTTLSTGTTTGSSQVLNWTAVTETNFNHYEIWYGEDQGDVQGRTGTAVEWDDGDDGALATRTTATTTITGLSSATTYYYKIWAIDDIGNPETVADINQMTNIIPIREQSVSAGNAAASTVAATWPGATTSGNLLIAIVGVRGGSGTTITPPAGGWTVAGSRADNGTTISTVIYYIENAGVQSGSSSWGISPAINATLILAEYSGMATSSALDVTATNTGQSSTADSGTTASTAMPDSLAIAGLSVEAANNFSGQTNGFTELADVNSTGGTPGTQHGMALEEKILSATGAQNVSASTGNKSWAGAIAVFKASTDSPPSAAINSTSLFYENTNPKIRIDYTLTDANSNACNLTTVSTQVQYATNLGGPWTDASIYGTTTGITSSAGGTAHTNTSEALYWNATGVSDGDYYVQMKPHNGTSYAAAYAQSAATVSIFTPTADNFMRHGKFFDAELPFFFGW